MMAETTRIEKLNGNNFTSWKYNVKLVLMERGLWNIVNGKEKRPVIKQEDGETASKSGKSVEDDNTISKEILDWDLRSDKAYSIIAINIKKDLLIHVQSTQDPAIAWDILCNILN